MAPLHVDLRNQLARAIQEARREGEAGARKALQSLAVHLGKAHDSMDIAGRSLRGRLRAHGKQLGDMRDPVKDTQEIDRLAHEVAYEHWHRMLFARFLAENNLLIDPTHGVAISVEECEELARDNGANPWALAASYAQAMLPKVFLVDDPVLDVQLPPETRLALERVLQALPSSVFTADDSLGWTYQFWQAEKKDEVNRSGVKIGADELPAVTQLFTEHYMVLFLFHNTIGAWWAGKVLAANSQIARDARDEEDLRRAVRLSAHGGYDFSYLRFVREQVEGDPPDAPSGQWRPAAGTFNGWPARAADLRVLDRCGSGHFLIEALALLVRLRMEEERLSVDNAVRRVLAENLFGLEIDARCTQIAAFNLALAAWKLVGKPIDLPPLNISCSGQSVGGTRDEWLALLGEGTASPVRFAFGQLYDLFSKAPSLGSLIDPHRFQGGGMLDRKGTDALLTALGAAIANAEGVPERSEMGVAAQGLAKAAEVLAGHYTLVITNVPYLGRGNQGEHLKTHIEDHFSAGKSDLATAFVLRCLSFCRKGCTAALVTPQNWLFLTTYKQLRERLLQTTDWNLVAKLGPGAFETISGEVVNVALLVLTACVPTDHSMIAGIDVSTPRGNTPIRPTEKARLLRGEAPSKFLLLPQRTQLDGPDARISLTSSSGIDLLESYAICRLGLGTGDSPHYVRKFWELNAPGTHWSLFQTATDGGEVFGGFDSVVAWDADVRRVRGMSDAERRQAHNQDYRGREVWGCRGVAVSIVSDLKATAYLGNLFDKAVAAIVPRAPEHLSAIAAFIGSTEFRAEVRKLDQKLMVTNATLIKVPFDLDRWTAVAAAQRGGELPAPEADSPAQWLFHGRPEASTSSLHVAVARLVGYRWPAEFDTEMQLSEPARKLVRRCDELLPFAANDGIVCIPSVRGNQPASDRLLALLSACGLKTDRDLDAWLRSSFFEEHCKLFLHRPFIWHIWDGRPDGFHALVSYHKLAGPKGEGRRTLEALTYSYLGNWIERQKDDQRKGNDGADGRLAAALDLQTQLERVLAGEPPCDVFVRWKPLHEQPVGWDPDINDGVRINIRPFMSVELRKGGRAGAGILRWKPNITWKKDRGAEPKSIRPIEEFPWFWVCPGEGSLDERTDYKGGAEFDGCRWNDLHYSLAEKHAARAKADRGGK
jgi:hypothetical protein